MTEGLFSSLSTISFGSAENYFSSFKVAKQSLLKKSVSERSFVYANSPLPGHVEFSGTCPDNVFERWEGRLYRSNVEMRKDIEIIEAGDRDAVIIIAGDHGPAILGDCHVLKNVPTASMTRAMLQDRFGAFLAIKWPDTEYDNFDNLKILQDVFLSVFAWANSDPKLMQHRLPAVTLGRFANMPLIKDSTIIGGLNDGQLLFISTDDVHNDSN